RLTKEAVLRATSRHAGKIRNLYGASGKVRYAEGKDLTEIKYIIGTGGALTRLPNRIEIMKSIAKYNTNKTLLFPQEQANILVDNDYTMASIGVLSKKYEKAAIKLICKSLGIEGDVNVSEIGN
ncbi:MAG: glutamate mutase L, partial [Paraclostridium sp.]